MPTVKKKVAAPRSKATSKRSPPSGITRAALPIKTIVWRLAEALYPGESPTDARKRVRSRITYAQDIGALPQSDPIDAERFVTWVREKMLDWPYETVQRALPLPPYRAELAGTAKIRINATGALLVVPDDKDTLAKLYAGACREIEALRRQLSDLEAKCERDAQRRQKGRDAGLKGGRGNNQ